MIGGALDTAESTSKSSSSVLPDEDEDVSGGVGGFFLDFFLLGFLPMLIVLPSRATVTMLRLPEMLTLTALAGNGNKN